MDEVFVFDVDGTLLDTSCAFWGAKEMVALKIMEKTGQSDVTALALAMREYEHEHMKRHGASPVLFGNMMRECYLHFLGEKAGTKEVREARGIGDEARARIETWSCPPIPGAIEALAELREQGARIALCTKARSISHQRAKIERWGLDKLADFIHIVRQKGAAEIIHAAHGAGMKTAADVWMTGDSAREDIAGAKAAGMKTAWIRVPEHIWLSEPVPDDTSVGADLVVSHVRDAVSQFQAASRQLPVKIERKLPGRR